MLAPLAATGPWWASEPININAADHSLLARFLLKKKRKDR